MAIQIIKNAKRGSLQHSKNRFVAVMKQAVGFKNSVEPRELFKATYGKTPEAIKENDYLEYIHKSTLLLDWIRQIEKAFEVSIHKKSTDAGKFLYVVSNKAECTEYCKDRETYKQGVIKRVNYEKSRAKKSVSKKTYKALQQLSIQ